MYSKKSAFFILLITKERVVVNTNAARALPVKPKVSVDGSKVNIQTATTFQKGLVVRYIHEKGYGWIRPDNKDKDVFFHITALNLVRKNGLLKEQINNHRVDFKPGPGNKLGTTQAIFVKLS